MSEEVDFIIIGQGIAGSVLSLKLLERGYSVKVFDQPSKNHSSKVAAGIFNPVTGRNLVKTWKADSLWPSLYSFYQATEVLLNKSFFHELPQYRPFRAVQDVNDFMSQGSQEKFGDYLESFHDSAQFPDTIQDSFGGILFAKSGYLNIPVFLQAVRQFLQEKNAYRQEQINYEYIRPLSNSVSYQSLSAKFLIFCDGWHSELSKYFRWLPFRPVKGEILTIQLAKPITKLVNRGVFILPQRNGECIVGSTYDRENINNIPTESGRKFLESKLNELINVPYKIIGHRAGIRPTTLDRRPFVGIHPKFETIGILNGLGTKGVSLSPHFADELIKLVEKRGEIDVEADISRYKSLYL